MNLVITEISAFLVLNINEKINNKNKTNAYRCKKFKVKFANSI